LALLTRGMVNKGSTDQVVCSRCGLGFIIHCYRANSLVLVIELGPIHCALFTMAQRGERTSCA
jgi:hypothetical protein